MKKTVNYDVSGGSKTFTEVTAAEMGTVLMAATATTLSAYATFTPLIGPHRSTPWWNTPMPLSP